MPDAAVAALALAVPPGLRPSAAARAAAALRSALLMWPWNTWRGEITPACETACLVGCGVPASEGTTTQRPAVSAIATQSTIRFRRLPIASRPFALVRPAASSRATTDLGCDKPLALRVPVVGDCVASFAQNAVEMAGQPSKSVVPVHTC